MSRLPDFVRRPAFEYALAYLVPFAFYAWTMCPTIGSGDTVLLIDGIRQLLVNTHVNNHNWTVLTGWLIDRLPIGSIAWRANFTSVVTGAAAIALYYATLREFFGRRVTASLGAAALMISHSMWWHSTVAEVYAYNALFTVGALYLLQRAQRLAGERAMLALFAWSGLAFFNHVQLGVIGIPATVLMLAAMLASRGRGEPWSAQGAIFARCAAAFLVGFLPYLATFVKDVYVAHAGDWLRTLRVSTGGDFQNLMFKGTWDNGVRETAYLIWKQFPSAYLPLVIAGVVMLARRWRLSPALIGLAGMFAVTTYFFMFFNTWDRFAFLLPSFILLAFAGTFALDAVVTRLRADTRVWPRALGAAIAAASLASPPWLYSRLADWGATAGPWFARYNNEYTHNSHRLSQYIADPNKRGYREFERHALLVLDRVPQGAIVFDDDSRNYYGLYYFQRYEGIRPDVSVRMVNSWGFSNWGESPEQFRATLERARRAHDPLFLVTLDHPFRKLVFEGEPVNPPFEFDRIDLEPGRWMFRLRPLNARPDRTIAEYRPTVRRLVTGTGFNVGPGAVNAVLKILDPVMAQLQTEPNVHPYPLEFEWRRPDGAVHHRSAPYTPAPGNTAVWSHLEGARPWPPGRWRVDAIVRGKVVATAELELR